MNRSANRRQRRSASVLNQWGGRPRPRRTPWSGHHTRNRGRCGRRPRTGVRPIGANFQLVESRDFQKLTRRFSLRFPTTGLLAR